MTRGGEGSHWEDCWRTHIDCAERRVESLEAEVVALKLERDEARRHYEIECAGSKSRIEEVHRERTAREQAEWMVAALRAAGDKALPFVQLCEVDDDIMDDWIAARDALYDAVMRSTTIAAEHDARVRAEALEEAERRVESNANRCCTCSGPRTCAEVIRALLPPSGKE